MKIVIPELSLVVLIGASGSGKSTFARKHFKPSEVLSSDFCRGLVSDDVNSLEATKDAFDVLHFIAGKRLAAGRLTVIDATSVQPEARRPLVALARQYHCLPVAVVFDLPEKLCVERNRNRADRDLGAHVIRRQMMQMRRGLRRLKTEGFRHVYTLSTPEEEESAEVERQPLWNNRRQEHGPFDIIGDVHGCLDELLELLDRLGYTVARRPGGEDGARWEVSHPDGRRVIFLGDLVDRGPDTPGVLRLAMDVVQAGAGLCVPGNHDAKLVRALKGRKVQVAHGLARSLEQLAGQTAEFQSEALAFLDGLVSHYVLDDGRLVVAHAGLKEEMQGRGSGAVREFCLYGETTGESDEYGLPIRIDWAASYRGQAMVVYGHTVQAEVEWANRTVNIDTGCVFGGALTALRYPEKELVQVPARRVYYEPSRPPAPVAGQPPAEDRPAATLRIEDVLGKRVITTRLQRQVTIGEEHSSAALEVMSRFAVDPRWLIYLPPTMSPAETSARPGLLEHPAEAFEYYRGQGVERAICEVKHMGSRSVLVVCRDRAAARQRFGVEGLGSCFTRTGRPFFGDPALQEGLLARVRAAMDRAGLWEELGTDWVCLDCELMPWSAKAQGLLKEQYAAVGAAGQAALSEAVGALEQAQADGLEVGALLAAYRERAASLARYVAAYQAYCWPVNSLEDLRLAPFHLLASEGAVHADKSHLWHMETLARLCPPEEGLLLATGYRVVDLADTEAEAAATRWWEELTEAGGEGMVVKPFGYVGRGKRGLVQPAIKCRGPEYLRIIYGPEYATPENLALLRRRHLAAKRSLAMREFALGLEALERFVAGEPLYRVHECVFGVLALESEPVDPRL